MTQLIIGGVTLPEAPNDAYKCYPLDQKLQATMIDGTLVEEVQGTSQVIEYSYDCMDNATYTALLAKLRGEMPLTVSYLPDDSADLKTGDFLVTSFTPPSFAFSKGGAAVWHNIAFQLREAEAHD